MSASGSGMVTFGYTVLDSEGHVQKYFSVSDAFEERSESLTKYTVTVFIGRNITSISPRFVGNGNLSFKYGIVSVDAVRSIEFDPVVNDQILENSKIRFFFNITDLTISVLDKRTGRQWVQPSSAQQTRKSVLQIKTIENGFNASFMDQRTSNIMYISYQLSDEEIQYEIQISEEDFQLGNLLIYAFETNPDESFIIPHGEGMIIPVNHNLSLSMQLAGYSGHGLSMGFFGIASYSNNTDSSVSGHGGYMIIIQTVDDASITLNPANEKNSNPWVFLKWQSQKGLFAYNRRCKYVFFDDGGHVTIAKRYRGYAQEVGFYKSFKQKIQEHPQLKESLENMRGAANIWLYQSNKDIYAEMQDNFSMKYILSSHAYGDVIDFCNNRSIVSSRYDVYQDAMEPNTTYQLNWHQDWINESYERNQIVIKKDGTFQEMCSVYTKDNQLVWLDAVSDQFWPYYLRQKVDKEIEDGDKRTCRFIDGVTATAWFEDYSSIHPSNRTLSKHFRKLTLAALHDDYGMVCGSETGIDAAVAECDYFEGMMSLASFRIADSGHFTSEIIYGELPENLVKYQVGERYRLPLWELVYHECAIAYWYWGDFNNKMPAIWRKRDLFNALYGVPPMYQLNRNQWAANKTMFNESYHIASPVAHETMFDEMETHRVLKSDWTVQQTYFKNGIRSTVNFGNVPFTMNDGYVLEPMSNRIEENVFEDNNGISDGAIAGIVIGVLVFVALIISGAILWKRHQKNKASASI
ncbi:Carbohydrate binding domain-containing protein [Histomonas meleagridis]|uniref:Carbohydrate binding domain-containing protein n=1 Tax=Histomonas meleagridis TaxID=135588 RepID=UPI00355A2BFB|nr:Carbohydrate binding domain-containing protein [Histomonas meleagridis]KAH0806310.1 Carbohydrate binding domain-containing protein [Histomonas meleagridis]